MPICAERGEVDWTQLSQWEGQEHNTKNEVIPGRSRSGLLGPSLRGLRYPGAAVAYLHSLPYWKLILYLMMCYTCYPSPAFPWCLSSRSLILPPAGSNGGVLRLPGNPRTPEHSRGTSWLAQTFSFHIHQVQESHRAFKVVLPVTLTRSLLVPFAKAEWYPERQCC